MRTIALFGRDVLRRHCRPVDPTKERAALQELLRDMRRILAEQDGLALAAPQAGEPVRVFIAGTDTGLPLGGHTVFVNPELVLQGPVVRGEEGCLSFPGIYADVDRYQTVQLKALDENGESFSLEVSGLAARMFQHEVDHLEGILLVDRMGPLKRRLLKSRLKRIRESAC